MKPARKVTVEANKFYRWFRNELRDPVIAKFKDKDEKMAGILDSELPVRVKHLIEKYESNQYMNGNDKMHNVVKELGLYLSSLGYNLLMPFLKDKLEKAVLYLYREHFMREFKRKGWHDILETILNTDIDEDGDVGEKNDEPKKTSTRRYKRKTKKATSDDSE